jgi:hypothetical protein
MKQQPFLYQLLKAVGNTLLVNLLSRYLRFTNEGLSLRGRRATTLIKKMFDTGEKNCCEQAFGRVSTIFDSEAFSVIVRVGLAFCGRSCRSSQFLTSSATL